MNTVFFDKAVDERKHLNFKDIFSEVFKKHTKAQRGQLLSRGIGRNIPAPSRMLKQWQKPWLFARIGIVTIILSLVSILSWMFFPVPGTLMMLFVIPAFAIPLVVLIFFWELNIPGDVSLYRVLVMMLIGGIISILVTGIVSNFIPLPDAAYIAAPLPEEFAKFLAVCILMSVGGFNYGVSGILIGGAVGVGFSAIESSGYAWSSFDTIRMQGAASGFSFALATQSTVFTQLLRGILSLGGHVVWAAMYGGAIGLVKGEGRLKLKHLVQPIVIMTFSFAFLLHTIWDTGAADLLGVLPDSVVLLYYNIFERTFIKYIILIVLAWLMMLFIMRKSIRQVVSVSNHSVIAVQSQNSFVAQGKKEEDPLLTVAVSDAFGSDEMVHNQSQSADTSILTVYATGQLNSGQQYKLEYGASLVFGRDKRRANVHFPGSTPGVSSLHCEITMMNGYIVLIDRGSTYGTFFANGMRLKPNVPYQLKGNEIFYLAAKTNSFRVQMREF